jgi:hypothetical protein
MVAGRVSPSSAYLTLRSDVIGLDSRLVAPPNRETRRSQPTRRSSVGDDYFPGYSQTYSD